MEKPVVVEDPKPQKPDPINCDISVSANDLDVKVLECFGNVTQRRITLRLEVLNRNDRITNAQVNFISAFTADGTECKDRRAITDGNYWCGTKMPPYVSVKQDYFLLNVTEKITSFSYVELEIRSAKVIIRNLPVQW